MNAATGRGLLLLLLMLTDGRQGPLRLAGHGAHRDLVGWGEVRVLWSKWSVGYDAYACLPACAEVGIRQAGNTRERNTPSNTTSHQ